jgi:hypothetical protein
MFEQVEGLLAFQSRGRYDANRPGPSYEDFASKCQRAGYVFYGDTHQLSKIGPVPLPQFRVRLLMFATRADIVRLIGPFKLPALPDTEHTPISSIFNSDRDTFEIVAAASELIVPKVSFYHLPHKPHQCGTFDDKPVWAVSGLSPCILTANSPLFLYGHDIVTPSLLGFARIQGFGLKDLPKDPLLARRAIGNGYASTMHQWAMHHYVTYLRRALSEGAPLQIPATTRVPCLA